MKNKNDSFVALNPLLLQPQCFTNKETCRNQFNKEKKRTGITFALQQEEIKIISCFKLVLLPKTEQEKKEGRKKNLGIF